MCVNFCFFVCKRSKNDNIQAHRIAIKCWLWFGSFYDLIIAMSLIFLIWMFTSFSSLFFFLLFLGMFILIIKTRKKTPSFFHTVNLLNLNSKYEKKGSNVVKSSGSFVARVYYSLFAENFEPDQRAWLSFENCLCFEQFQTNVFYYEVYAFTLSAFLVHKLSKTRP